MKLIYDVKQVNDTDIQFVSTVRFGLSSSYRRAPGKILSWTLDHYDSTFVPCGTGLMWSTLTILVEGCDSPCVIRIEKEPSGRIEETINYRWLEETVWENGKPVV